jgi:hypothetical protein
MKLKNFLQFNENMDMDHEMHRNDENTHYMFFENLRTIKRLVDELLTLDETEVDEILESGHDWAADHIAVAKVDIEQVFDFLVNNTEEDMDFEHEEDMDNMMHETPEETDMEDMEDYSSDGEEYGEDEEE